MGIGVGQGENGFVWEYRRSANGVLGVHGRF